MTSKRQKFSELNRDSRTTGIRSLKRQFLFLLIREILGSPWRDF
jgi:hypothetical protein